MYATTPDVQVGTYPDLWRKGRYRVELTAGLRNGHEDVDAALEQLGYEVSDCDQWGRSYRHREDPERTAELDELEHEASYVKLILREGDLDKEAADRGEEELFSMYERIYQLCLHPDIEEDYHPWCLSQFQEDYRLPTACMSEKNRN